MIIRAVIFKEEIIMSDLMRDNRNKGSSKVIRIIDIKKLEENIPNYVMWLKKTNRVDRIDTYKEFLQI